MRVHTERLVQGGGRAHGSVGGAIQAARRAGRNPETIRRWIRAGKLPARKIGTQHVIEEDDLEAVLDDEYEMLPLPPELALMSDGRPQPNWVRIIWQARESR